MTRQNPILKRVRISTAKFRQILKYFALDIEATKIAQLTGLNRNTINKYLLLVRKVIALECEQESPFSGEVEVAMIRGKVDFESTIHSDGWKGYNGLVDLGY